MILETFRLHKETFSALRGSVGSVFSANFTIHEKSAEKSVFRAAHDGKRRHQNTEKKVRLIVPRWCSEQLAPSALLRVFFRLSFYQVWTSNRTIRTNFCCFWTETRRRACLRNLFNFLTLSVSFSTACSRISKSRPGIPKLQNSF